MKTYIKQRIRELRKEKKKYNSFFVISIIERDILNLKKVVKMTDEKVAL